LEVAGIELGIPNSLIDPSEVTDGELRWAEAGRDRGVLKTGSGPLYGVGDDPVVVEREAYPAALQFGDRNEFGIGVAATKTS